jgi:hypothetical protein
LAPRGARVGGGSWPAARKARATPPDRTANTRRARRSSRRRLDRATVRAAPAPGQTGPGPAAATADLSSSQVTARAPVRHARAGVGPRDHGREKCRRGLWTTACWGCGGLVSVSRVAGRVPGRTTSPHPSPLPRCSLPRPRFGWDRTGQIGATYVHRLWTTVWTATGERSRDPARTAGMTFGTQSPPPGSGRVTTDTVRTARTPGGTTA